MAPKGWKRNPKTKTYERPATPAVGSAPEPEVTWRKLACGLTNGRVLVVASPSTPALAIIERGTLDVLAELGNVQLEALGLRWK